MTRTNGGLIDPAPGELEAMQRANAQCPACDSQDYDGCGECPECGWSLPSMSVTEKAEYGRTTYTCDHCGNGLGTDWVCPDCLVERGR